MGLATGAPAGPFGAPEALETRPVTFSLPGDARIGFRGALAISPPRGGFGGISALLKEGERTLLTLSDRAVWRRFDIEIKAGRLVGVGPVSAAAMLDAGGVPVSGGGWDAEGLARTPDGVLWVSFEQDHRIQSFAAPDAPAGATLRQPEWERFPGNSGIEALAADEEGRLWAIPERSGHKDRPFPVYVGGSDGWEVKRLPRRGDYLPTGADFGPDGWLYVTERAFSFTSGFRFRLRRLRWGGGEEPVAEEELLRLPSLSRIDNIEAVTVWEEGGETLILIASDDNFSVFQRNILALFSLK